MIQLLMYCISRSSPQIRDLYIHRLRYFLAYGPNEPFQRQLIRYFDGELPHSSDLLTSLLQAVMDGTAANDQPLADNGHVSIQRVSYPWPVRTKKALRAALDYGAFEDIRVTVPSGPESTEQPMYFAGVVDETVGTTISRRKSPTISHQGVFRAIRR